MSNFIDNIINNIAMVIPCVKKISSEIYVFSTNHNFIGYFVIFFILILLLYLVVYKYLKLDLTFISFIAFMLFMAINISYYLVFISVLHMESPVYLTELSRFSFYKYILLTILGSFCIFVVILKILLPNIFKSTNFFKFLNMQEEIRKILYYWNNGFIGDICCFFYAKLATSLVFSYVYFFIHFVLFFVIRFISLGLLLYFVFFEGNLYSFILIIPLMYIVWLLRFLDYYFIIFIEGTKNYLMELLKVTYTGDIEKVEGKSTFLKCDPSDLQFALTSCAKDEGFTSIDLDFLTAKWFACAEVTRKFTQYNNFILKFKIIILGGLYLCWLTITIHYFNNTLYLL